MAAELIAGPMAGASDGEPRTDTATDFGDEAGDGVVTEDGAAANTGLGVTTGDGDNDGGTTDRDGVGARPGA